MLLLRHSRTFRRLWLGQSISVIGDGMQRLALLWWAKVAGGTGLLVAIALCTIVPGVVFSPFGGSLADRHDRRRLMVGADLARVMLTGTAAILVVVGGATQWLVCGAVALSAIATAIFDPTYAATVPTVVDDAELPAANGLNMANSAVGGLVGPLLGGVLIAFVDIGWVMAINAATFAWSAVFVMSCRLPAPAGRAIVEEHAEQPSDQHSGIRGGLSAAVAVPGLRRLLGLASVLNMVVAPLPLLIVALAIDRFGVGSATFGMLQMLLSAGVLVGAIAAPKLVRGNVALPMVLFGCAVAAVGASPIVGSGAALFIAGVAMAVTNTELITMFQRTVPAEVQGRVFGLVGALSEGLRPAGLVLGGPLLATLGVTGAFLAVGGSVVFATLAWGRGIVAQMTGASEADVVQEDVVQAGPLTASTTA